MEATLDVRHLLPRADPQDWRIRCFSNPNVDAPPHLLWKAFNIR